MNCRSELTQTDIDAEIWRDIPGYNGVYQVSTFGRVRKIWPKGTVTMVARMLKTCGRSSNKRAPRVKLRLPDGRYVTPTVIKAMADTFLNIPDGCVPVCKNGIHEDTNINNIAIMSYSEVGKRFGGSARRRPVVKIECSTGDVVEFYSSAREAARNNYISRQAVIDRCNGALKRDHLEKYTYRWDWGV